MAKIILKNSTTAGATPSSLDVGELGVRANTADAAIFWKDSAGTIKNTTLYPAPLDSPSLTGTPETTKPSAGDDSYRIPTTSWVLDELAGVSAGTPDAYSTVTDGTTSAAASSADTLKFRGDTGITVAVQSNDGTHGDNVKYSLSANLVALSGVTSAADKLSYWTGSGTASTTDFSSTARTLLDDTSTSAMRSTLGVSIGSDVLAYDASLQSLASLATAANKFPYTTAADTYAEADISATALTLLDDASTSDMRTTLGVAIGSNVQAYDATLQSLATNTGTAADRYAYTTGVDTWTEGTITAAARGLLDDSSTANMRTTLGLVIGTDVQAYDAGLANLASYDTNGLVCQTSSNTFQGRTITSGTGISVSNGAGTAGNPQIALSHLGIQNLTDPNADRIFYWNDTAGYSDWLSLGSGLAITSGSLTSTAGAVASGSMYENSKTISSNYTITSNKNAMSAGPITISNGVVLTIPSGSRYVVL